MELKIETQEFHPFAILTLDGWFAQAEVYKLKHECSRLVEYLSRHFLILDLANVTFIDSSGVGVLVHIDKACKALGGQVTIVQPKNTMVLETLYTVSLPRFIDFHPDVPAAIAGACKKFGLTPPGELLQAQGIEVASAVPATIEQLTAQVRQLEERLARMEAQLSLITVP